MVLSGEQAHGFVRSRYLEYQDEDGDWRSDPTADLGRITRQQTFVRRAVAKAVKEGLSNPVTLNKLVSAGIASVSLDEQARHRAISSASARRSPTTTRTTSRAGSIPSEPMTTSAGAPRRAPVMRKAQTMLNIFRGMPPGTLSPERIDLSVLNGTGVNGQAADAAGALSQIGFNVIDVASCRRGRSPDDRALRPLRRGDGEAGRRPHHRGAALVADPALDPTEVILLTGSDFDDPISPLPRLTGRSADHDVDHRSQAPPRRRRPPPRRRRRRRPPR